MSRILFRLIPYKIRLVIGLVIAIPLIMKMLNGIDGLSLESAIAMVGNFFSVLA